MGEGSEFAKRNSSFIKIDDGDSIEGVFEGRKFIFKDVFGEEKEVARYKIDGKTFDSSSGKLAVDFDNIPVSTRIKLSRKGTGIDTKYTVLNLSNPEKPTPEPQQTEQQKAWDE